MKKESLKCLEKYNLSARSQEKVTGSLGNKLKVFKS